MCGRKYHAKRQGYMREFREYLQRMERQREQEKSTNRQSGARCPSDPRRKER